MHNLKTHAKRVALSLLLATVSAAAVVGQNAFISTIGPSNITMLNTTTNALAGFMSVPGQPTGIAITPDGAYIYAACQGANSVAVVSTSSYKVVTTIPVETTPIRLAMKPDGKQVYVVNQASNSVSVIDVASNTVVATILVGSRPTDVAFSPDGSSAYVTNYYGYTVSMINTLSQSVSATWSTAAGPQAIVVRGDGTIYVACQFSNAVSVFGPTGNSLGTISGFAYPSGMAVSSDGSRLYVANANAATLSVVDTGAKQIVATVATASSPTNVRLSRDSSTVYVISQKMSQINVVSAATNAVVTTVKGVGPYPVDMVFPPVNPPPVSDPPPPPPCSYSLTQSSASFTSSGGTGSVNVTAGSGCAWTAVSNAGWVTITSGASGSGNGTVDFTAGANTSSAQMTGTLTIAGQTYTITEAGLVVTSDAPPADMAQGKAASQSSTYGGALPSRAVDGNTDGVFSHNSVSHTNSQANAWWELDLGSSAAISSITIWNRTDCCSNRLSDYWVFVSDTPFGDADTPTTLQTRTGTWSAHQTSYPNPSSSIPVSAQGRYVRVQLSGTNYLSLAEVQVFGTLGTAPVNVAQGKTAAQSSTYSGATASRAVDGNTDGVFAHNSVSHTNSQANAWWGVDLGSSASITSINVWNRTDCCSNRLSDYWVFVSDSPFGATDTPAVLQSRVGTWSIHLTSYPNPSASIPVNTQGRYVRVQLSGTNYLSLAEVQVFGN